MLLRHSLASYTQRYGGPVPLVFRFYVPGQENAQPLEPASTPDVTSRVVPRRLPTPLPTRRRPELVASGNAARPGATSGSAGARVSLRRSFTGAAVAITTGARESWRRWGGGWGRRPREGPGGSGGGPHELGAASSPAGGRAPRTSPRPSPRAGTELAAEPLSSRAPSPDSMARGERAAAAPPTRSRNPSSRTRQSAAARAAGRGPGAGPPRARGMGAL